MASHPLISVIIPTYNGTRYLADTIRSVLEQTYPHIEIIISDDASTDATVAMANEFAARHPHIRVLAHPVNQGVAKNYNDAIGHANGEFGIGLGQDDLLPPEHIARMVAHFSTPQIALVHCNALIVDSHGDPVRMAVDDAKQILRTQTPLKYLCFNNFIQSCGMMYRMSALKEIGLWDETYAHCSEWNSYIRYACQYKLVYATDTHAFYRRHTQNLSKKMRRTYFHEYERYKNRCRLLAAQNADLSIKDKIRFGAKLIRVAVKNFVKGLMLKKA